MLATGLFGSLAFLPSVQLPGEFGFLGADSFYHAVRILDAAGSGWFPAEFDSLSYAPSGHLVAWPWLYDFLMGMLLSLQRLVLPIEDSAMLLGAIPPALFVVNGLLIMLIAQRAELGPGLRLLALLLFSWTPNVHYVHGFGHVDHHFAETTAILSAVLATMRWVDSPRSGIRAVICGVVFAVAQGVATSLIVLLICPVFLLGIAWWRGRSADFSKSSRYFSLSLVATLLLLLLPSKAFAEFKFAYYWFSWFQLAVSAVAALLVVALASIPRSHRSVIGLVVCLFLAALLLGRQILQGAGYLSGDLPLYGGILEVRPVYESMKGGDFWLTVARYTPMILLTPLLLVFMTRLLLTHATLNGRMVVACFSLFGLALASTQYRFNYFAYLGLSVGVAMMLVRFQQVGTARLSLSGTLVAMILALTCVPGWRLHASTKPWAGSHEFSAAFPIYLSLRQACEKRPGLVLARWDRGHYVRYFSRCSVLANNMVVTPVQVNGALQTMELFRKRTAELIAERPQIDYVLLHNSRLASSSASALLEDGVMLPLEAELFGEVLPEGVSLVAEHRVPMPDGSGRSIARLLAISRGQ